MIEIGAGGGSIARVDRSGCSRCGPESRGRRSRARLLRRAAAREPTVTDADLVLGYLDPGFFLGGRDAPRRRGGADARSTSASPSRSGSTVEEAAWGIHQLVNEDMASAARVHAAERGHDATRPAAVRLRRRRAGARVRRRRRARHRDRDRARRPRA